MLRILSARSDTSVAELSKLLRVTHSRARYSLQRLKQFGIFRPFALINSHALGYQDFCLFFSFESGGRVTRHEFLEFLTQSERTAWVAELCGEYAFSVSILAKNASELGDFVNECSLYAKKAVVKFTTAIRVRWFLFPHTQGSGEPKENEIFVRDSKCSAVEIDQNDQKILFAICCAPTQNVASLAASLKLPVTTVAYRIKRLREQKIILGMPSHIESSSLGLQSYRIMISERTVQDKLESKLYKYSAANPYISGLIKCIGSWSYELNVELPFPSLLGQVVSELERQFGDSIHEIRTFAVLQTTKICLSPHFAGCKRIF